MKTHLVLFLFLFLAMTVSCDVLSAEKIQEVSEVAISANKGWQDTGIQLQSGDRVLIEHVSGQATDGASTIIDGSGIDYLCDQAKCCEPLPGARRSSLIGRVGRTYDEVFFVGNGVEITVSTSGSLFLRINDCNSGLDDNTGGLGVRITY